MAVTTKVAFLRVSCAMFMSILFLEVPAAGQSSQSPSPDGKETRENSKPAETKAQPKPRRGTFEFPAETARGAARFLRALQLDGLTRLQVKKVSSDDAAEPKALLLIETADDAAYDAAVAVVELVSTPNKLSELMNFPELGGSREEAVTRVYKMPNKQASYVRSYLERYSSWDIRDMRVHKDSLTVEAPPFVQQVLDRSFTRLREHRRKPADPTSHDGNDQKQQSFGPEREQVKPE